MPTRDPRRRPSSALAPRVLLALAGILGGAALAAAASPAAPAASIDPRELSIPWREAGWSEREAAEHLLSRFTYGARPGEVERVVERGLERWFAEQLAAALPDPALAEREAAIEVLALAGEDVARRHPPAGALIGLARSEGMMPEEAGEEAPDPMAGGADAAAGGERSPIDAESRRRLVAFARDRGLRGQRRLGADLGAWTLYRALLGENQLREVMADFWTNHFYVSLAKPESRAWVLPYVRDAMRPRALGTFGELLDASARHPAMLLYLDNARSAASDGARTTLDLADRARRGRQAGALGGATRGRRPPAVGGVARGGRGGRGGIGGRGGRGGPGGRLPAAGRDPSPPDALGTPAGRRPRGLNENYARELLELHTLGVDGGYDQRDVVEVARAFTGWSALPPTAGVDPRIDRLLERARAASRLGFVVEGGFVFRPDVHDAGPKRVLGERLAAGRGIEDGEEVLEILARHPSTARHLAEKLALRFVSDRPPAELVDRLAAIFVESGGDVRRLLIALVESPELWAPEARHAKVKTPFELVVSALRATGAQVATAVGLLDQLERMGQPLFGHPAPTGYPDTAEAWVSAGAVLERMRFGVALAGGEIPGVAVDPALLAAAFPAAEDPAVALGSPAFQRR